MIKYIMGLVSELERRLDKPEDERMKTVLPLVRTAFEINNGEVRFREFCDPDGRTHFLTPLDHLFSILDLANKGLILPNEAALSYSTVANMNIGDGLYSLRITSSLTRTPRGLFPALSWWSKNIGVQSIRAKIEKCEVTPEEYIEFVRNNSLATLEKMEQIKILIVGVATVRSFCEWLACLYSVLPFERGQVMVDVFDRSPVPIHLIRQAYNFGFIQAVVPWKLFSWDHFFHSKFQLLTQEVNLRNDCLESSNLAGEYSLILGDVVTPYNLDQDGIPRENFFAALTSQLRPGGFLVLRDFIPLADPKIISDFLGIDSNSLKKYIEQAYFDQENPCFVRTKVNEWILKKIEEILGGSISCSQRELRLGLTRPQRSGLSRLNLALANPCLNGLKRLKPIFVELEPADGDRANVMVTSIYQQPGSPPVLIDPQIDKQYISMGERICK